MIVLGIDIGSRNYAYSLVKVDVDSKEKFKLIKTQYLNLTHPEIGHRLLEILKYLKADIQEYKPELLAYEDSKFQGKHAPALHFCSAMGHLCSGTFNIPIRKFSPAEMKRKVTGNGKADKKQVEKAVISFLSNPPEDGFDNDHIADSCAICLCPFL